MALDHTRVVRNIAAFINVAERGAATVVRIDAVRELLAGMDPIPCQCGCPADTHEHYRRGTDCGHCGRLVCPTYRPRKK